MMNLNNSAAVQSLSNASITDVLRQCAKLSRSVGSAVRAVFSPASAIAFVGARPSSFPVASLAVAAALIAVLALPATRAQESSAFAQIDVDAYQKAVEGRDKEIADKLKGTLKDAGYQIEDNGTGPVDVQGTINSIQQSVAKKDKERRAAAPAESETMTYLYWFFMFFTSITGMGFFAAGKRNGDIYFTASGLIMMIYPFFVTNAYLFVGIAIALVVLPFYMSMRS